MGRVSSGPLGGHSKCEPQLHFRLQLNALLGAELWPANWAQLDSGHRLHGRLLCWCARESKRTETTIAEAPKRLADHLSSIGVWPGKS